ncbi:MAG: hypothetical protein EHM20_01330 [Alphaproteobacteria bacterium]|nr:MAG: hypothetical protein EHM20_01330 [Alphaproteobacteria bacterium]
MLQPTEFPIIRKTDRDLEIPVFHEFLERNKGKFESVLDVGAHYSIEYYAKDLRNFAKKYWALDPLVDFRLVPLVDWFYKSTIQNYKGEPPDLISCLSVIEHIGSYPEPVMDIEGAQDEAFEKMLKLAKKMMWISFPVGLSGGVPAELMLITKSQLDHWKALCADFHVEIGYYWSDGPQAGEPWRPSSEEVCFAQPYDEKKGTRALCVMEIYKGT